MMSGNRNANRAMEIDASSSIDRKPKSRQKSRITNGALLPGIDQRSRWVRRCKDIIADFLSAVPDATPAEQAILRCAGVMKTELEMLERDFALAGQAKPEGFDLYIRGSGNLRRLLETVGLQRRARDVSPGILGSLAQDEQKWRAAGGNP
jgi:hypothetical protein